MSGSSEIDTNTFKLLQTGRINVSGMVWGLNTWAGNCSGKSQLWHCLVSAVDEGKTQYRSVDNWLAHLGLFHRCFITLCMKNPNLNLRVEEKKNSLTVVNRIQRKNWYLEGPSLFCYLNLKGEVGRQGNTAGAGVKLRKTPEFPATKQVIHIEFSSNPMSLKKSLCEVIQPAYLKWLGLLEQRSAETLISISKEK